MIPAFYRQGLRRLVATPMPPRPYRILQFQDVVSRCFSLNSQSKLSSQNLIEPFMGRNSCENVAAALNKAGVENLLWGSHLMSTYRVPALLQELTFVVPDNQLQRAVDCLDGYHLPLCRKSTCEFNVKRDTCWNDAFMNPPVHFHFGEHDDMLQLFTLEDSLLDLPAGKGTGFTDGAQNNIIFANDATLLLGSETKGMGRFPTSQTAVRIPTWQRYVEALILNYLRDYKIGNAATGWMGEFLYIIGLGDKSKLSHPAFKTYCHDLFRPPSDHDMMEEALHALGPRFKSPRPRPLLIL